MPKGGARTRSRTPDPNSERSLQRGIKFTALPAEGYSGNVPDFPMGEPEVLIDGARSDVESSALAAIEARLWDHVWSLPQAAMWAAEPWRIYTVAAWVRVAALCETPYSKAADRAIMLRLQDEIGLTGPGLARNGWTIGTVEPEESEPDAARGRRNTKPASSRDRLPLKVIDGGR